MYRVPVDSAFMGLRAHSLVGGKHVFRQCLRCALSRVTGAVTALKKGPNSGLRVREDFQKKVRYKLTLNG